MRMTIGAMKKMIMPTMVIMNEDNGDEVNDDQENEDSDKQEDEDNENEIKRQRVAE
jgi:hypothetical protein